MTDSERDQVETSDRVDGQLYSPGQVAGATFLGSPIAGAWLLAANYREWGEVALRRKAFVWGSAATVVLFVVSFVLPERFPRFVLPAAYTFAMLETAKRYQGRAYRAHLAAGGAKYSSWRAAGIGLAWLCGLTVALFVALVLLLMLGLLPE